MYTTNETPLHLTVVCGVFDTSWNIHHTRTVPVVFVPEIQEMTYADFQEEFPHNDACLEYVFRSKYPDLKGYRKVKNRLSYQNSKGHQIHPLKGTIFGKSKTPLIKWFYVMFMMSQAKNGVSAKEVQRYMGVTYKCAWRMCRQIRTLMTQPAEKLKGVVEADEVYIGAQKKLGAWKLHKSCVIGAVERGGLVRAKIIQTNGAHHVSQFIRDTVVPGSTLYTDYSKAYDRVKGLTRDRVMHSQSEYVRDDVYTNTIEGVWSHMKRGLKGTYASVSKQHLQLYVDQYVFLRNYRTRPFAELLRRI